MQLLAYEKTKTFNVPLKKVTIEAKIVDLVARVSISQHFECDARSKYSCQVLYKFPVDDSAAVYGFEALVDDDRFVGFLKEKKQALRDYDSALQRGKFAALVEDCETDVFQMRLGNFRKKATIVLSYVCQLKYEFGQAVFFIPTTIAPRYNSTTRYSSGTRYFQNDVTADSTYQISLLLDCVTPSWSSHPFSISDDGKVVVAETLMDRDIIFHFPLIGETSKTYQKLDNGKFIGMITHYPKINVEEDHKVDFWFLVDSSGSMDGMGLQQAKAAMQIILHAIPTDSYFNIIKFDDEFKQLFVESSQKYSEESLNKAKIFVSNIKAGGGTEIYPPLKFALRSPAREGYQKQIFVLTDGEVSNVKEIVGAIRRYGESCRVFSMGLGSSACHYLVNSMAKAGNGTSMFASFSEKLETKILKQMELALKPSMNNATFEWKPTRQIPEKPDPVFEGNAIVSFGYFDDEPKDMTMVKNDLSFLRMATKREVDDLMDLPIDRSKTIVKMALEANIASKYTSFVAIGESASFHGIPTRSITVPNQLYSAAACATSGCAYSYEEDAVDSLDETDYRLQSSYVPEELEIVRQIIQSQRFDGSFDLHSDLINLLGYRTGCVTAFVIDYLETRCKGSIDIWRLIVQKARRYLEDQRDGDAGQVC
jgi:hypothetical protein